MGRIVGIDYGKRRIGLALSDEMRCLASPFQKIEAKKTHEETIRFLLSLLPPFDYFVLGLPLLMSGKDSDTTTDVRAFASLLETLSQKKVILKRQYIFTKIYCHY